MDKLEQKYNLKIKVASIQNGIDYLVILPYKKFLIYQPCNPNIDLTFLEKYIKQNI